MMPQYLLIKGDIYRRRKLEALALEAGIAKHIELKMRNC